MQIRALFSVIDKSKLDYVKAIATENKNEVDINHELKNTVETTKMQLS